ncbi:MAG: hypothetical protein Q9165_003829 [Trypethelium subeluteriae]
MAVSFSLRKFPFRSERTLQTRGQLSAIENETSSSHPFDSNRHNSDFSDATTITANNSLQQTLSLSETSTLVSQGEHGVHNDWEDDYVDLYGLQLVTDAPQPAPNGIDIVFVHGLGGNARRKWSWKRDESLFWPKWLVDEENCSAFRIFTFGYNSNWRSLASNLNITDFAKELLLQLLAFDEGSVRRKIVFVAHSLGGLVVKKAYILGKQESHYADIVARIHGMIFLATPHRGAQYATMVNNILRASNALQDINEQFWHCCQELALVSFFETVKTGFGFGKAVVVDKDSAVLQYLGEISSPLNADYHTICKFRSRGDSNYMSVRNIIKYWAMKVRSEDAKEVKATELESKYHQRIEDILGLRDVVHDDLDSTRLRHLEGTCRWLLQKPEFLDWLVGRRPDQEISTFWLFGLPATGKTVISSVVIDHIQAILGDCCSYHFFSAGHQAKRTVAYCLRSVATQLARTSKEFREKLILLNSETGISFSSQSQDFSVIWEKIFEGIVFKLDFGAPTFWILDAVDEADSHQADTQDDICAYVTNRIQQYLPDYKSVQLEVIDQVLRKARGSFLWVRLALESLDNWHTKDDIHNALHEVPSGIFPLYTRMLEAIEAQPSRNQHLSKRVLTWVTCSWRHLGLDELRAALEPEFQSFLKFEESIRQTCGHFVAIENRKVSIIHETARQLLLHDSSDRPAFIQARGGHTHLAITCLDHLSDDHWRRIFHDLPADHTQDGDLKMSNRLVLAERGHPLLGYATCYWVYHLSHAALFFRQLTEKLEAFLTRYSLTWVEGVALSANLQYLTKSAKYMKSYASRGSSKSHASPPLSSLMDRPGDDLRWIKSWANDFIRIVGKFGPGLLSHPSSIYRNVPPFYPRSSVIGRIFGSSRTGQLSVTGLEFDEWNDCLASVSVSDTQLASKVFATATYFITLVSATGDVQIWHAETCEAFKHISIGQYIATAVINKTGTMLATVGLTNYMLWEVSSGDLICQASKSTGARTMALSFTNDDQGLIAGLDDASVVTIDLATTKELMRTVFVPPNAGYEGCPRAMAFSPDLTKLALAWRGKSPLIWNFGVSDHQVIRRYSIPHSTGSMNAPEVLKWLPDGSSLLVLCQDTNLVKWNVYEEQHVIYNHLNARQVVVSSDRSFLLSSDNEGTISVWSFPHLPLVYRLVSGNEYIRDITFSPDKQRIYDVRESMCNIWEPEALVRLEESELEDNSSLGDSSLAASEPTISQTYTNNENPVTVLSEGPRDDYYCCGREDGSVTIHEAISRRRIRKVYSHSLMGSVLLLAWSRSGRFMASADDSARVIVKRLEFKAQDKWAVFPVLDVRMSQAILQILFSPDENYLLVSAVASNTVYDLKRKQAACWKLLEGEPGCWVNSPRDSTILLQIQHETVHLYKWASLVQESALRLVKEEGQGARVVVWATCFEAKSLVIYGTLSNAARRSGLTCLSHHGLHLESISISGARSIDGEPRTISRKCFADLAGQVKRIIGVYKENIVYLNHDHWLCTWDLDRGARGLTKHFFLPKDWLNVNSLQKAVINDYGTLFCLRYGQVATVRNGIKL